MSSTADMKAMLSKTVVIVLYLCGFRPGFTYNIQLDFLHSHHKELSNKTDFICRTHFPIRTLSITISGEVETIQAWHVFNDFAGELLRSLELLKVQIDTFGSHKSKLWDYYNVVYVDSERSFRRINPGENTKHQDFSEFYLVIYQPLNYDNQTEEMEAIFAYCWSYFIVNVSVMLVDSMEEIRIFTYFPFNEKKCFSTSVVEIRGSGFRDIFPPKTSNLHKCQLIGALWLNPPYISWKRDPTSTDSFIGFEGQMLMEIAKNMNFTLKVTTPPNDERRGLFFKNGTVSGAIKIEKEAHLSLGCFRYTLERATPLSASYSYYQTDQVFFVKSQTEHWTTFEIMTYPFDFYIWTIMLIIIITAMLLSIFLEKYKPSALYFIFGCDSGKAFNVISAWLGYPVIPEPRRNFARFILTIWIFSTLVLRNAYQGLLYTFLSSNLVKSPPDTSMQLAKHDYVVVVSFSSNDTISQLPIIQAGHLRMLVQKMNEKENLLLVENTNSKIASTLPKSFVSYYVLDQKSYGQFHVLKESIFAHQVCVYFTKHSFLTARFNEVLKSFRSFGLIDYWSSKNLADELIENKASRTGGEISLTMNQLDGAFVMLGICLFAAGVIFIVELMSLKYNFLKKWFV